jgi:serine protease Do
VKKVARLLIPLLVLLVASQSSFAQQLTKDEKRALELKPGVVLVVLTVTGNVTFSIFPQPIPIGHAIFGTGFLYRPDGYIITNGHVVEHANMKDPRSVQVWQESLREDLIRNVKSGDAFTPIANVLHRALTDDEKVKILKAGFEIHPSDPTLRVVLANGQKYDADILQFSPPITENKGKDVAVIKIPATDLPTVPLGDSSAVRIQDPVLVIGYPATVSATLGDNPYLSNESDLVPSATDGHVSALKETANGSPVLQTDVAITHGNSGGPAFNDKGEAIGIATFGTEAAGFNFLVPINTAMEFVRQTGVAAQSGQFDKVWANALNLYDAGQCKAAIPEFDSALQMLPNLPDARQYRNLAAKCWDDKSAFEKFRETSGWMAYAAIGIVVLAILLIILLRRGSPSAVVVVQPGGGAVVQVGGPPPIAVATPLPPPPPQIAAAANFGSIQQTTAGMAGRSYPVTKDGIMIGRSPKCQIQLNDDTISGEHAWIVPAEGEVFVIDRGSSNGTYINSVDSPRVSKMSLKNGDKIYLGKKGAVFTYFS